MWSPVTSAGNSLNDSSSTSSSSENNNEPLTIHDIEKWHTRTTTAMMLQRSFNTDTSTLENTVETDEEHNSSMLNIAKGVGGASFGEQGSVGGGSSAAGSVEGHSYHHHNNNGGSGNDNGNNKNPAADNNNASSRQVVAALPWRDGEGYVGTYTGEVNDDNVPDGLGLIRYDRGGEQEGEWRDGTLILRKKGNGGSSSPPNPNNNNNNNNRNASLSTIEEEKSHKAPSIKYTDEFANFLAAKQIGIGTGTDEDDGEGDEDGEEDFTTHMQRRFSQSSNSMAANTTGDNSNARDFADYDAELYSSTSSTARQSHHNNLYYYNYNNGGGNGGGSSSDNNSRKGHLYSSSNSRQSSSDYSSRKGHLYSSTNSRHSSSDNNSRKGHLYSSTNSRHSSSGGSGANSIIRPEQQQQQQQYHPLYRSSVTKRSPTGESTTVEGSSQDSDSDRHSISSGDGDGNYTIDYGSYRNIQQTQSNNHHHPHPPPNEELGLVAVEEKEEGEFGGSEQSSSHNKSSSSSSSGGKSTRSVDNNRSTSTENIRSTSTDNIRNTSNNVRNNDEYRPNERNNVPHETIDAIQKLMANDSNVQYDSEETSDDENDHDSVHTSAVFDWHKDRRKSVESYFPGIVEDSDDEMHPSIGTRRKEDQEENDEDGDPRRFRRFSSISLRLGSDPDNENGRFRSRWWCCLFSVCSILSIIGIAVISWAMVRMRKNSTSNDPNLNVPKPQSADQDAGTKASPLWETDDPCAPVTIDITTDQYGNETTWALYRFIEVNNETNSLTATRAAEPEVGQQRARLRPVALSGSNRNMEESTSMEESTNYGSEIRSGGPYTYTDGTGTNYTSPMYTSSVCLPEGNYNFVISDVNGICCQYGLGQYSIYFNGGRTVRDASGVFTSEEITPFVVSTDDLAALSTASPSRSLSPSTSISLPASLSPSIVPSYISASPSPKLTVAVVSGNSSVSLNLAPQTPQPTLSVSTEEIFQSSTTAPLTGSPILTQTIAPSPTVSPPPTVSESVGTTSQSSVIPLPETFSPILSQTTAPSAVSLDPPIFVSLSPTPRMTNTTTSEPTVQTISATSIPSTSVTPWPSQLPSFSPSSILSSSPSFSPSQFPDSIPPTTSSNPTDTAPPSSGDPLLDIELLDSLSIPYTLSHILTGETHQAATSRRLQDDSTSSLYGFSTAVSADMSVLAVGAPNAIDVTGNRTGAVYLYNIDTSDAESSPTLVQELYGWYPDDEFGNDVKLSDNGNRLVVAARSENEQEGAIRIYERTPGTFEWYIIRTIVGAGAGFRAGWSVAISGDGNVVAMGSTKGSSNEGGMVITYIAPDWGLHGSIIEAQTPRDVLGFSVSLNGDGTMVAVGSVKAANPDRIANAGRAEVFSFDGTSWISQFEVYGETKQAYVGSSVALSRDGNLLVVGGRGFTNDGGTTPASGRCRIFERTETGEYELLSTIVGKNSREELGWSSSISADGNKVACGGKDGRMLEWRETGVARVWDRLSLLESEVLPRGERLSSIEGAGFGSSVSLSSDGSSLVVGASTWSGSATASSAPGAVQIFGIGTQSVSSPVVSPTDFASVTSSPTAEIASQPTADNQLSSSPTSSTPLSAMPTMSDPLLDIELLDSLSSPYSMTRFLQGESADSLYGFSTALSADMSVLAVGATNAIDENGDNTGAVYLYNIDPSDPRSSPTLVQVLYGSNPGDEFGNDVKLSDNGNRLVVAARSENEQEGAIRMYQRRPNNASGLWEVSGTILGEGAGFRAGWSVAISGDGMVVAMGSTKGGSNEGGIVSTYIAPNWELHGPIIEAQTPRDVLGFSVALNGDGTMVAVGGVKASNPDRITNAGRAEVFSFDGTSWISQFEVYGETKQAYVGSSVALSRDGNLLVVGGRGFTNDGGTTPASGRCRIFERTETGEYELLSTIVGKNSREELGWSSSISADGNKVACGGKDGRMLEWGETGVARVWDRLSLLESEVLPRGERLSSIEGAGFGSSVSLSSDGSSLLVGAWQWNGANITSPGGVYSFSMS